MSPRPCGIAVMLLTLSCSAAQPDVDNGRKLFAACAACHAPESPTKTGPDLRGVFGRKAATVSGFRYSKALQKAKLVWNEMTLDAFLADPQVAVPGNLMPFPGLPDVAQRSDVIAFLKTLNVPRP